MQAEIGISKKNSQSTTKILNILLADEYILVTKTKNAHWNLEDVDFYNKHILLEKQYVQLDTIIDSLAERIRAIIHYASASLKSFLEQTHLTEAKDNRNDSNGYLIELLADHESMIIHCRENIETIGSTYKDYGTADFLTGLMEEHEKMAWFIRSHIVKKVQVKK